VYLWFFLVRVAIDLDAEQTSETSDRRFVVGLGNPGRKYARTRHNVGFMVLELLQNRWHLGAGKDSFEGLIWNHRIDRAQSRTVTLLAPMTYMNCSGRSVRKLLGFYKAKPSEMLVVLDDLALPLGRLRLRTSGSAGGHNGLDDIIRACETDEVPRLRIGIGQAPGVMDPKDYVLGKFDKNEIEEIGCAIQRSAEAVEDWLFDDMTRVMEKYNRE
jgi:PTH1 family peptidyl-tRNA hydrolase